MTRFWGKPGGALSAVVFVWVIVQLAYAGTCVYYLDNNSSKHSTVQDAADTEAASTQKQFDTNCATLNPAGCNVNAHAVNCSVSGSSWHCDEVYTTVDGPQSGDNCLTGTCHDWTIVGGFSGSVSSVTCEPGACDSKAGQEAFYGGNAPASGNVCDGTCEIQTAQPTMIVRAGSGVSSSSYESWYTGNTCTAKNPAGDVFAGAAQCFAGGGGTACSVSKASSGGKNCGTFNGDEVCVQSIPPGTCQSFASGGVACTAARGSTSVASPPGPDNGTAGQPATPTGSVSNGVAGTGTTTTNYYSSSTVLHSTVGVGASPTGQNVGDAGSLGSSSGTGSGSGDGKGNAGTECGNGKTSDGAGGCVSDGVSGGGACASPPVCTGDPVQCDQDFQTWKARCPGDTESDLASALGSSSAPNDDSEDVSSLMSETGPVSSVTAACPEAPTVSINGQTLTLSLFDRLCDFSSAISWVVMAVAYLVGGSIFVKGVLAG